MNAKILLSFIFIFTFASCNYRVISHYSEVLKNSLEGYHIVEHESSMKYASFQVYMDSLIKEQLALVEIVYSESHGSEYINLKVTNSVAQNFEKQLLYQKELLDTQTDVYREFFKMIFTSPDKNIDMVNVEDIYQGFLENQDIESYNMDIKIKVDEDGNVILKFTYEEATILALRITKSFELMLNQTHKVTYNILNVYSQQNNVINKNFQIDALSSNRTINTYMHIIDMIQTRNYINSCYELLSQFKKAFPQHYIVQDVDLDQIQYDFRLGAVSKFFKIKTYNGSFIFAATYFEDEDIIGKYEFRIYKIPNFDDDNFKLYTKDNLKTIQLYRLSFSLMSKFIDALNLEKLLNVLSYEVTQLYIQSHQQVFGQQFSFGDNAHGVIKHDTTTGLFSTSKITQRTVYTFDKKENILFEFMYSENKGNVSIQFMNNQIQDEYTFDFDVRYYNKELVRNFFVSCLHIDQQIESEQQFNKL